MSHSLHPDCHVYITRLFTSDSYSPCSLPLSSFCCTLQGNTTSITLNTPFATQTALLKHFQRWVNVFKRSIFGERESTQSMHTCTTGRGRGRRGISGQLCMSREPSMGLDLRTLKPQPELKPRVRHFSNSAIPVPLRDGLV